MCRPPALQETEFSAVMFCVAEWVMVPPGRRGLPAGGWGRRLADAGSGGCQHVVADGDRLRG